MSDSIGGEVRRLLNKFNALHVFKNDNDKKQTIDEAIANAIYDYCGDWCELKESKNEQLVELQMADTIIAYLDWCGYEIRKKP
jgi:hypothetical protein